MRQEGVEAEVERRRSVASVRSDEEVEREL